MKVGDWHKNFGCIGRFVVRPVNRGCSQSGQRGFYTFGDSVVHVADISSDHRPREKDKAAADRELVSGIHRFLQPMLYRDHFLHYAGRRVQQGI